ncbi:class I SAM-dependent methyltransferase [Acidiphilium sp.]|uniref:class I SAM-dependent methyltransferase n=1 Tax=Acidiphilium sp. TaxID=527 RepID=UPI003CFC4D69
MQVIDPTSRLGRLIARQAQKRHLAAVWAELAGIMPGMTVLDVGAGSGALSFEYAAMVGPGGLIIALNPDAMCRDYVAAEAVQRGVNLRSLLGTVEALPLLPAQPDRVMLTDALHHMENPVAALRALRAVIHPQGLLFIAEYDPAGEGAVGVKLARRTYPNDLLAMLAAAKFSISATADAPDEHYTIIARP